MPSITPEEIEQSVRNWVHRLEQTWNAGNIDGCIEHLQATVTITTARTRTISRDKLKRGLRRWYTDGGQAKAVIESVQMQGEIVAVIAHIHFRCVRGEELEEAIIRTQFLIASGMSNSWTAASIDLL